MIKKDTAEKQIAEDNKKLKRKVGELTRKVAKLRKQLKQKQFEQEDNESDDDINELEFFINNRERDHSDYCPKCGTKGMDTMVLETAVDVRHFLLCKNSSCRYKTRYKTEEK